MTREPTDWREADSSWVLDHGLPDDLPAEVPSDLLVPVAYWVGTEYGVVMSLQWSDLDDDIHEHRLHTETEVYERREGSWVWTGSGGSAWPDKRLVPRQIEARGCRFTHLHCQRSADNVVVTVDGIVGSAASSLVAADRHGSISAPVDSPVQAVITLVEPDPQATVVVLDHDGNQLGGVTVDRNGTFRPIDSI